MRRFDGELHRRLRLLHDRIALPLLDVLLPSDCFACRGPLGARQRLGACAACWSELDLLEPPLCPGCALPVPPVTDPSGPAGGRCAECVGLRRACGAIRAAFAYDELARRFLLRAKLGRRPELLEPFGQQLARLVELTSWADGRTLIVPAPSHPWVTLRRGFSPAAEIARPLARKLGLPLRRALRRSPLTRPSWKQLPARERRSAARRAFRARGRLAGERVLLVDDVMTTGATLEACAAALIAAGVQSVRGAVWARTLRPFDRLPAR